MDKEALISKYRLQIATSRNKKLKAKEISREIDSLRISKEEKINIIKKICKASDTVLEHFHSDRLRCYGNLYSRRRVFSANDEYVELVALMIGELK